MMASGLILSAVLVSISRGERDSGQAKKVSLTYQFDHDRCRTLLRPQSTPPVPFIITLFGSSIPYKRAFSRHSLLLS